MPFPPSSAPDLTPTLPATGHDSIASSEILWLVLVFQAFKVMSLEVTLSLFGLSQPRLLAYASEVPGMFAGTGGRPVSKECLFLEHVHTVLSTVGIGRVSSAKSCQRLADVVEAPAYQKLSVCPALYCI